MRSPVSAFTFDMGGCRDLFSCSSWNLIFFGLQHSRLNEQSRNKNAIVPLKVVVEDIFFRLVAGACRQ